MEKTPIQRNRSKKTDAATKEAMLRRFRFAKASLAIEGLCLTSEEERLFESLIAQDLGEEQLKRALQDQLSRLKHDPLR